MPSERRRQRQQRVRHEAGDFVCDAAVQETVQNATAEISSVTIKTINAKQPEAKSLQENYNSNRSVPKKNYEAQNYMEKRGGERRLNSNQREREKPKYGNRQGPPRDRILERKDGNIRQNESRPANKVAFAEEKEYEPVTIMESTSDTVKEPSEKVKYRRREVISNWLQYEELPPEEETVEGEDYMLGEDFTEILKLHGSTNSDGFLHLKGEMSWGDINPSNLGMHGLGALKVADLIASLATLPLHMQLKIPEESLPAHDIYMYKNEAESRKKTYKPDQEYVTDIDTNEKILQSLKLSESDSFQLPSEDYFPESTGKDSMDATLKFSSAFVPEPDDVDLDTMVKENTTETVSVVDDSRKVKKKQANVSAVASNMGKDSSERLGNDKNATARLKEFNFSVPNLSTTDTINDGKKFNFGLHPKSTDSNKTVPVEIEENHSVQSVSEEKYTETVINLDAGPVKNEEPVKLVSKSEAESLEDWLDSVLDD